MCIAGYCLNFSFKKTLKRRLASGMTDDIFQKSHLWVKSKKGVYCAYEQFDDVRN